MAQVMPRHVSPSTKQRWRAPSASGKSVARGSANSPRYTPRCFVQEQGKGPVGEVAGTGATAVVGEVYTGAEATEVCATRPCRPTASKFRDRTASCPSARAAKNSGGGPIS
eukprot:CAMPEP_0180532234 /NCGR_PEP_ID=MMETSP1036_2-20121128/62950_1 /TAXON_ID=632150 /ORGANISM="Azadinium spinosum, Strain 3D9" /LENGTH=110 /DNA_ID=CAMNT_0022546301 /DNA_START=19 /DNA_END=348 /DNA_ORIENTATION=+